MALIACEAERQHWLIYTCAKLRLAAGLADIRCLALAHEPSGHVLREKLLIATLAESESTMVADMWRSGLEGAVRSQPSACAEALPSKEAHFAPREAQAQAAVLGSEVRAASYETQSQATASDFVTTWTER